MILIYIKGAVWQIVGFKTFAGANILFDTAKFDTAALRPVETRRLARLEELLHTSRGETPSMAEIACLLGTNPVSLQALTRRAWGCTVFERLRAIRMQRAHAMLEQGADVARAADVAGFSSAANFATAYKRRFGVTPRQTRV